MELFDFDNINPVKCIFHQSIGPFYSVPHRHEALELCYVKKGNPGTLFLEGNEYSLNEGDVYIINSDLIHGIDVDLTENQELVTVFIDNSWLMNCIPQTIQYQSFEMLKKPKNSIQQSNFNYLVAVINKLVEIRHNKNLSRDRWQRQLSLEVEIANVLIKNFSVDMPAKHVIPEVIANLISDFHEQYKNDIHLADMGKKYNYDYAYFSKLFKKYLNISPKKYLTMLRIQEAAKLVLTTDKKFSQVAVESGFPDEKSFYTTFKEKYRNTPLEYRRKFQSKWDITNESYILKFKYLGKRSHNYSKFMG